MEKTCTVCGALFVSTKSPNGRWQRTCSVACRVEAMLSPPERSSPAPTRSRTRSWRTEHGQCDLGDPATTWGCPALIPGGERYCPRHKAEAWRRDERERGSSKARGASDPAWVRLRAAFVEAHPHCQDCLEKGRRVPVAIVHHLVHHFGDDRIRLDPNGLRSLCRSCHGKRHAAAPAPGYRVPPRGA
jgi:5-methylcytosine-specific restriction protein A